ncbi:MAG: UDP-N-acetylmuramoyl-tripeptide--D-alanyl-D-alanine ligase [Ginsengibacter sp.]|jgi:UDP-N-acetylmuramoyl-tripeptide--D-alanyl-D-alanine ligase
MTIEEIYSIYKQYPNIQTDSRKLKTGDLFFALKGPNFNGNLFAKEALETGAVYVIADEEIPFDDDRIIHVDNVLKTLQNLAKRHREQFNIPFIAITGSNGKTTTKELIHAVLSTSFKTYTTIGNLNNHIGIPLTILRIKPEAEMAVIEMGANHQHEIEEYCMYAQPNYGLITNIGKAHLEGFGGLDGVKKGKGELFTYLGKTNGTAFVYSDDANVVELSERVKNNVHYGSLNELPTGRITVKDPFIGFEVPGEKPLSIQTNLVGSYNLPNLLAAVCVGRYFKVKDKKIKDALENYIPSNSRSQLIEKDGNKIILDAYNANPGSMKLAIENLAQMKGEKKILFLGDMKELGTESKAEHQTIVNLLNQFNWSEVILVGANFGEIQSTYKHFENSKQAAEWFKEQKIKDALILVKGSRSMEMEQVVRS